MENNSLTQKFVIDKFETLLVESGKKYDYLSSGISIEQFKIVLEYFLKNKEVKLEHEDPKINKILELIKSRPTDKEAFQIHLNYLIDRYETTNAKPIINIHQVEKYDIFETRIENFIEEFNLHHSTELSFDRHYKLNLIEIWNILITTPMSWNDKNLEMIIITKFPELFRYNSEVSIEKELIRSWMIISAPSRLNLYSSKI